ncbi:MAG: DUF2891 family protein [Planctomycetota bacterium]
MQSRLPVPDSGDGGSFAKSPVSRRPENLAAKGGSGTARRQLADGTGDLPDPTDGKLAHLDGLNLSRARALQAIALHFKTEEPHLHDTLTQQAAIHRQAGLQGIHPEHYAGSHWLASFALEVVHPRNA